MIAAVVLAAGQSRRMGTQKLLLPYGGKPVIAHIVAQALAAGIHPVVVVVREEHDEIARALTGCDVRLAVNLQAEGDMLSSVRAGLKALPAGCAGTFVLLGDQPSIGASLLERMAAAAQAHPAMIVLPVFGGQRGHPLLIPFRFFAEVLSRYEGIGLRGLLCDHPDAVCHVQVGDAGVLADMDQPDEYQRELRRLRGQ